MGGLKPVLDGVWRWRWFSEDKGMDFNGYAARLPEGLALVDPVYADERLWLELEALGRPALIVLTNKDHERASDELRRRFGAPVAVHEADAPLLAARPERTFGDGALLGGALRAVRLRNLKSPGECALHWPERRLLFVGDAATGHPPGSVGLVKKHAGRPEVLEDLRRLLELDFDAMLVGDGEPFPSGGKRALEAFLRGGPA